MEQTEVEKKLNQPVVEAKDFRVTLPSGEELDFYACDDVEYQWAPTAAGALLIYRKTKHVMFSATIKDERILMLAAGQWTSVELLEDDDEGEG